MNTILKQSDYTLGVCYRYEHAESMLKATYEFRGNTYVYEGAGMVETNYLFIHELFGPIFNSPLAYTEFMFLVFDIDLR